MVHGQAAGRTQVLSQNIVFPAIHNPAVLFGRLGDGHPHGVPLRNQRSAGGQKADPHFVNFIQCLRSRKNEELAAPILEGHMAASICHLCNIAYRTGRTLAFDSAAESFPDDPRAQELCVGTYRKPYTLPEKI